MNEHILVVFPHPDDEAFGVAGTIAQLTNRGVPVTYICLTLGEMGRNMGIPPFTTRESLPEIRKSELDQACKAVGITDLRRFGYRDKTVEFEDRDILAARILEVVEELKPSRIITFYPGYSVHPDHEATAEAVVHALSLLPENSRPELHCVAFARNTEEGIGKPDIVNDVSDVFDRKMDCIKAHKSQTDWLIKAIEQDPAMYEWAKKERFWVYKF
ncbi:bacillithiol biosynthesis deacetylase BshB2 [Fictibacillus aquaticus]|uniref:Bacillithiol biosynthesis deacetylase BshB2 n=1 Tax=Fictibacillus aquaticus TaxID=2021314 RepID=A0A235F5L2_9BACL|nr:bacillithiol biosynthesis deacetylase BshB2 [Fictibacillus aquaticus]OYD56512.1 bacillithiol biosynthesis deacetylase BshB2 [Fictibacillus aquaticus]